MDATPALSVVVETQTLAEHEGIDRLAVLGACVESLLHQHGVELEILVVGGDTIADLDAGVLEARDPRVRFAPRPGITYVQMKWEGAHEAAAPNVAFVDADCVADPGWAAAAVDALGTAHACTGRTLYQADNRRARFAQEYDFGFVNAGADRPPKGLILSNMAIRKATLQDHALDLRFNRSGACGRLYSDLVRSGARLRYRIDMVARHHDDWRHRGWIQKRIRNGVDTAKQGRLTGRAGAFPPALAAAKRLTYDGYRLARWPDPDTPRWEYPILVAGAAVGRSIEAVAGVRAALRPDMYADTYG